MRTAAKLALLFAATTLTVVACGSSGGTTSAHARTVDIDMRDIAFSPDHVTVAADTPVRLVFHNRGKVAHDAFLGDDQAQMTHEQEMRGSSMGGMQHGGGSAITVDPGRTGTITHIFRAGDRLLIGCHQAGHYAAGMKLMVAVT